jgi:hypothetical protein
MPGEFYFMGLAGLGVTLAGFAGLIAALDRRPMARSPVTIWRIRNIVLGGFTITLVGFGTVALYTLTREDLQLTCRLSSLLLVAVNLVPIWFESRPGPAWPTERGRRFAIGSSLVVVAADLGNVVVGGLGYLQILFLVQLLGPLSIFFNTVRDATKAGDSEDG